MHWLDMAGTTSCHRHTPDQISEGELPRTNALIVCRILQMATQKRVVSRLMWLRNDRLDLGRLGTMGNVDNHLPVSYMSSKTS